MSRMKLFALEEEEVVDVQETAVQDVSSEIVESEQEMVDATDPITDGIDAVDELTEVKDVMDQSIEAGTGLDPVAAEMARISIRNILSKIGAEHYTSQMMVASESFGSTSSRLANTRYASEKIGEVIGKAWEAIVKWFADLGNRIVEFVKGIFDRQTKLVNRAMKLKSGMSKGSLSVKDGETDIKVNTRIYSNFSDKKDMVKMFDFQEKGIEEVRDSFKETLKILKNLTPETATELGNALREGVDGEVDQPIPVNGTYYNGMKFIIKTSKTKEGNFVHKAETISATSATAKESPDSVKIKEVSSISSSVIDKLLAVLTKISYISGDINTLKDDVKRFKVDKTVKDTSGYRDIMAGISAVYNLAGKIVGNTHLMANDALTLIEKCVAPKEKAA